MCLPSSKAPAPPPVQPPTVIPPPPPVLAAPAPEPTPAAPGLAEGPARTAASKSTEAKRKGTKGLRIDLKLPTKSTGANVGLNIPVA